MFDCRWPALTIWYIGKNRRFIAKSPIFGDFSRNFSESLFLHDISYRYPLIHNISVIYHWHIAIFSSIDLISLQIRSYNPRDQFKSYIQFILNYPPMIHTMQLFNLIKSNFKNLMNVPNLHCRNHPRQFEEKNLKISINQSIGSNYLCNLISFL